MRVALLTLIVLGGCQAVPDDHQVRLALGRSVQRLHPALDPRPHLERAAHDLGGMQRTAQRLAPWSESSLHRVNRIPATSKQLLARESAGLPHAVGTSRTMIAAENRRMLEFGHEGSTVRRMLSPSAAARRMERGMANVPHVLGFDRQPLPGPDDPNRRTDPDERPRPDTWVERIFRRLRL